MTEGVKINRGLMGVYFERSAISDIDGAAGELTYRGYSIHDLAGHATFEEVSYLLIHGELPTAAQLEAFDTGLRAARAVPDAALDIIRPLANGHPMDVLRTAVSALAALDPRAADTSDDAFLSNGLRLLAQLPTLIAAHHRIRQGLDPVAPDASLGHAANWLKMLTGEHPSDDAAHLTDVDLILHAEHGANASAFAARVTVGTEADMHGAIVTALMPGSTSPPSRKRDRGLQPDWLARGLRVRRRSTGQRAHRSCDQRQKSARRRSARAAWTPSHR